MLLATSRKYYYARVCLSIVSRNKEGLDEPDGVIEEDFRGVRRWLGVAAVVAHEPDADALLHKDLRGVVAVVAHEADALDEAGVDGRVVLLFFDAAVSMVAPHRWSRAGDLCVRLAYGSHRS